MTCEPDTDIIPILQQQFKEDSTALKFQYEKAKTDMLDQLSPTESAEFTAYLPSMSVHGMMDFIAR